MIGRIGGEEFAILLLETGASKAQEIAERLRQSIEDTVFCTAQGVRVPLRVSIGVAEHHMNNEVLAELMIRADKALYRAKHSGRNRVATVP
jgi:diguanylate cyclase (GGDEF)-like protein